MRKRFIFMCGTKRDDISILLLSFILCWWMARLQGNLVEINDISPSPMRPNEMYIGTYSSSIDL